ncbi:hypothetical protein [Kineococcus arenarius]|uniref:hypothetical protein n=1 Tax=Kineococcus sp. SYSU DK007 TaxID=3383128 RepID=UPI003D7D7878
MRRFGGLVVDLAPLRGTWPWPTCCPSLVQRHTPDELRGRVSRLWQVQVVTGGAVGSAAAGLLGRWFPPDTAMLVHGLAGLALVLLLAAATRPPWRWRTTGSARTRGPAGLTTTGGRPR